MTDNSKQFTQLGPLADNKDNGPLAVSDNEICLSEARGESLSGLNVALTSHNISALYGEEYSDEECYNPYTDAESTISDYSNPSLPIKALHGDVTFRKALISARKSQDHVLGRREIIVDTSSGDRYVLAGKNRNSKLFRLRSRDVETVTFRTTEKINSILYALDEVRKVPFGRGATSEPCSTWLRQHGFRVEDPYAFMTRVVYGADRPLSFKTEFTNSRFKLYLRACKLWNSASSSDYLIKLIVTDVRLHRLEDLHTVEQGLFSETLESEYVGVQNHFNRLASSVGLEKIFDSVVDLIIMRELFYANKAAFILALVKKCKDLAMNPTKVLRNYLYLTGRSSESFDEWVPDVFNMPLNEEEEASTSSSAPSVLHLEQEDREEKTEESDIDLSDGDVYLQGPPTGSYERKDGKEEEFFKNFPIVHLLFSFFKTTTVLSEVTDWKFVQKCLKGITKVYTANQAFSLAKEIIDKSSMRIQAFIDTKDPRMLWKAPGYTKYMATAAELEELGPNIVKYKNRFVPAKELLSRYEKLAEQERVIERSSVKPSSQYFLCKKAVHDRIISLRSKINAGEDRMTPWAISFFGIPGTGKSTLIHSFTRVIHEIERPGSEYSASEFYNYDVNARFQDGMQDPLVVDLGDLTKSGYSKQDPVDLSALMARLVDKNSFHVDKASLEDKEESFISPRVVSFTSNAEALEFGVYNPDQARLLRRFPYAVEVKYPEGVKPEKHEGFDHLLARHPDLEDRMVYDVHRTSHRNGNFLLKTPDAEPLITLIGTAQVIDWMIVQYKAHVQLRTVDSSLPTCNIGKLMMKHTRKCCSLCAWEEKEEGVNDVDVAFLEKGMGQVAAVATPFESNHDVSPMRDFTPRATFDVLIPEDNASEDEDLLGVSEFDDDESWKSLADIYAANRVVVPGEAEHVLQGNCGGCQKEKKKKVKTRFRKGVDSVVDGAIERYGMKLHKKLSREVDAMSIVATKYVKILGLVVVLLGTCVALGRVVVEFRAPKKEKEEESRRGPYPVQTDGDGNTLPDENVNFRKDLLKEETQAKNASYTIDPNLGKFLEFVDPSNMEAPPATHWAHLSAPGAVFSSMKKSSEFLMKKLDKARVSVHKKDGTVLAYAYFWNASTVILGHHYARAANHFMWNGQKIFPDLSTMQRVAPGSDTVVVSVCVVANVFSISQYWNESQYVGNSLTAELRRGNSEVVKIRDIGTGTIRRDHLTTPSYSGTFVGKVTENGDCGNLWVTKNARGEAVILGIHMLLSRGKGISCAAFERFTKDEIESAVSQLPASFQAIIPIFGATEFEAGPLHPKSKFRFIDGDIGIAVLGTNKLEQGFSQGPSKITVSDPALLDLFKPAAVIPDLPKMVKEYEGVWYDTYKHKLGQLDRPIGDADLSVLTKSIGDYFEPGLRVKIKPLSLEQAVFGIPGTAYRAINWTTSSGTNPCTRRDLMGKEGIDLDLKTRIEDIMRMVLNENFPVFVSKWSLKDEVIKPLKNDTAKYRVFMVTELEHLLLSRMFLLPVIEAMYSDLDTWEMRGHFNATSPQFREMFLRLKKFSDYVLLGDFSGMDSSLKATILHLVSVEVQKLVLDAGYTKFAGKMAYVMLMSAAYSIINCRGDYAYSCVGLDSGKLVTYWINCIMCSVLYRVAHYALHTDLTSAPRFKEKQLLDTGGDDSACATVEPKFTLKHIELTLQAYGYVYTDSSKKGIVQDFSGYDDFEFFKRYPIIHEDGLIYGALNKESIHKSICFYKGGGSSREAVLADALDCAVREYALWGRSEYDAFLAKLDTVPSLPKFRRLAYEEIIARYNKDELFSGLIDPIGSYDLLDDRSFYEDQII